MYTIYGISIVSQPSYYTIIHDINVTASRSYTYSPVMVFTTPSGRVIVRARLSIIINLYLGTQNIVLNNNGFNITRLLLILSRVPRLR